MLRPGDKQWLVSNLALYFRGSSNAVRKNTAEVIINDIIHKHQMLHLNWGLFELNLLLKIYRHYTQHFTTSSLEILQHFQVLFYTLSWLFLLFLLEKTFMVQYDWNFWCKLILVTFCTSNRTWTRGKQNILFFITLGRGEVDLKLCLCLQGRTTYKNQNWNLQTSHVTLYDSNTLDWELLFSALCCQESDFFKIILSVMFLIKNGNI